MVLGPDHVVHAVRDLDAAGDFYRRAGFNVGDRNRHPWGTHNRVVQLQDVYIELLALAEPERLVPPAPRTFSFGAFHQEFLAQREGLSMLLLKSEDASHDADRFRAKAIGDFEIFRFARKGVGPDGGNVDLAFSLAFANSPPAMPVAFAACQHHYPQNFWNPAAQQHANGARRLRSMIFVAPEPESFAPFLHAWTGRGAQVEADGSVKVHMETADIEVVVAEDFYKRFAVEMATEATQLAGLRFACVSSNNTRGCLNAGRLSYKQIGDTLVVPPETAAGATLILEPADMP